MDEFIKYDDSDIKIDVLGSNQPLSIDYVVRLQTSEGETYELTAADYYYEALELMLIYCDNEKNENREHISNLIQLIDQFRYLIYSTLTDEKNDLKEVRNNITTISNYLKISFNNFFETKSLDYQKFADLLEKEKPKNGWNKDAKYRIEKSGCIAFAFNFKCKWYFSLSGSSVDYYGNIIVDDKWSSKKIEKAYGEVKNALSVFMDKYLGVANPIIKECHLTDDTRRYVLYGGIFLSPSVTLENDVKRNSIEGLNPHYSCCERKILTYIEGGFVNPDYLKQSADNILKHYTFIIRYDPCEKCMPALFGCENIITGNGHRSIVRNFSCIDK